MEKMKLEKMVKKKMEQVYILNKNKKMSTTKQLITKVVTELVGEEALPIVFYLKGKQKISEFIIAEELDMEIHKTRNLLYRLYEHNITYFLRKKDKIKGWYICYWDFNEKMILELASKLTKQRIEKLKERFFNSRCELRKINKYNKRQFFWNFSH